MGPHIFVLFPHQTRYVVPAAAVHLLPDGVPPARAVLAANLETAVNGVWDARAAADDRVTVIGAGAVGCLVGMASPRDPSAATSSWWTSTARASRSRARSASRFADPGKLPRRRDVVIHASGSPAGLELALQVAGVRGAESSR